MVAIDYSKYSLDQLYNALESIDKEKYPENYEVLVSEIKKKRELFAADENIQNNSKDKDIQISQNKQEQPLSPLKMQNFKLVSVILFIYAINTLMQIFLLLSQVHQVYLISVIFDISLGMLLFIHPG